MNFVVVVPNTRELILPLKISKEQRSICPFTVVVSEDLSNWFKNDTRNAMEDVSGAGVKGRIIRA
jgi:hypothetical protein